MSHPLPSIPDDGRARWHGLSLAPRPVSMAELEDLARDAMVTPVDVYTPQDLERMASEDYVERMRRAHLALLELGTFEQKTSIARFLGVLQAAPGPQGFTRDDILQALEHAVYGQGECPSCKRSMWVCLGDPCAKRIHFSA